MAFHLFMSNSLEKLADLFMENLCLTEEKNPFTPVCTVTANAGMGAFLKRHLARKEKLGIAANLKCFFLQSFITTQVKNFLSLRDAESYSSSVQAWGKEALSWRIDALFSAEERDFPFWKSYWRGEEGAADPERRHALSYELATVFDRYALFRRDVLARWRTGDDDSPQARLFKRLFDRIPDPDSFHAAFLNGTTPPFRRLPERIGVFGIGAMSEFYLQCLLKIGEFTEIYLFSPSPCRIYWGDFRQRRELGEGLSSEEIIDDITTDNRILGDLGGVGRQFLNLLIDNNCFSGAPGEEAYVSPLEGRPATVLRLFQEALLDGRSGAGQASPPQDSSIRVNCCPNAVREMETLHDQLAELFYSKKLRPEDVIVMFPDINKAAPVIEAVFSNGPFDGSYAICDRSAIGQSSLIECFGILLKLPGSRCTSREILELLEYRCIHTKLGIDGSRIPDLESVVCRARIRWGLDRGDHEKFRDSPFPEFSWQDGIDRLMAEFARGEDAGAVFPVAESGGIDEECAEDFGALAEFVHHLKKWKQELLRPRNATGWRSFLFDWIDIFFSPDDGEFLPEILELRRAVAAVAQSAEAAGFDGEIAPGVFISRFKAEVSMPGGRQNFLRDKMTFCSLIPMRAVPAKVIAILSLNDGEFPGSDRSCDFDLLSKALRYDPCASGNGRYLLLEALMAARENLILSYVGTEDGRKLEPAVPLAVCMKVLEEEFGVKPEKIRLPSLETEALKSRRRTRPAEEELPPGLPPPPRPTPRSMGLDEFCRHLCRACDHFFELRYNFKYAPPARTLPEVDDPLVLENKLDISTLKRSFWEMRLAGLPPEEWAAAAEKSRLLPVRAKADTEQLIREVLKIPEELLETARHNTPKYLKLKLGDSFELGGRAALLETPAGIRHTVISFSRQSPEKKLRFYLEHLLLLACLKGTKPVGGELFFVNGGEFFTMSPPDDAEAKLEELREIVFGSYLASFPQPLFLNASSAFAAGKTPDEVKAEFEKDCVSFGTPTAVSRFYDAESFGGPLFEELARKVFGETARFAESKL